MKHLYAYANIAIILIGTVVFGYWYFIDGVINPPIVIYDNPLAIETDKRVYHRGETIFLQLEFCKNRDVPAVTNWQLVDGQILLFAPIQKSVRVGCYGSEKPYSTGSITIPQNVVPGVWHLEGQTSFTINPIKTLTYERRTVDFEIIP